MCVWRVQFQLYRVCVCACMRTSGCVHLPHNIVGSRIVPQLRTGILESVITGFVPPICLALYPWAWESYLIFLSLHFFLKETGFDTEQHKQMIDARINTSISINISIGIGISISAYSHKRLFRHKHSYQGVGSLVSLLVRASSGSK